MTKNKLPFTGERCVPENMSGQIKTYQHHIARYNFALMYARKKKVLDAACGSGFGVNLFYDVADYVMGMDISDEAIEYAREKYNGDFVIGDLNEHFPPIHFDIVISFETIEHLDDPTFFIENVKEHADAFMFSIPINDPSKFHKVVYTTEEIKELFEKHFDHIDWFSQRGLNITKGINEKSKYLIGYATVAKK